MKNTNKHVFFLKEEGPEEVHKLLLKLIMLSAEFIKDHLSLIFNESFKEGIVPDKHKSAIGHSILKGDSSMICENYWAISNLPILSKILEKLVHKRLTNHLNKYELLFKHQYSFQKGESTEHAILYLRRNIVQTIEKKGESMCYFPPFR